MIIHTGQLGLSGCPACGNQEFKLSSTSYSVAYYRPIERENRIWCLRCDWSSQLKNNPLALVNKRAKTLLKQLGL